MICLKDDIIRPAQHALNYYMEMQQALDTEKKRKEDKEEEEREAAEMVQLADDDADIKGTREKHKTKNINNSIPVKDTKSKGDSLLTFKDLDNHKWY